MIDVIIPTRNAPEVLALTLAHYWANAHDDRLVASVMLLDNCSEAPGMEFVVREATRRGCRVVRHERNVGVWASVNRGLALSKSEKVLVLTSDILLAPGAIAALDRVQEESGVPYLGPHVIADQLAYVPHLYEPSPMKWMVNSTTYNGACWLMARSLLDTVGWYDPRFFICFGDTDYAQQLTDASVPYGVTTAVRCLHLDKRSRRADHSIEQDTQIEIRDWERFAQKWKNRSDVLARHLRPDEMLYNIQKSNYWTEGVIV